VRFARLRLVGGLAKASAVLSGVYMTVSGPGWEKYKTVSGPDCEIEGPLYMKNEEVFWDGRLGNKHTRKDGGRPNV